MNKYIKLLYTTTLIIILFFSCSRDDNMDIYSNKYLSIPDASFETILIAKGIDSDGVVNKQMLRSDAQDIQELDLGFLEHGTIGNLSGIEGFTSLKKLIANQHNIEQIDLRSNILLEEIHLAGNYLSSIDVSKNTKIMLLDLRANQLTNIIGLSKLVILKDLNLSFNYFEKLTIDNESLEILRISNNNLISLDINSAVNITKLLLTTNNLKSLKVSSNIKLQTLLASNNLLKSIDLSKNISLTHLYLSSNLLSSLDIVSNHNLIDLKVDRNLDLKCIKITIEQHIPTVSLSNYQQLNVLCN